MERADLASMTLARLTDWFVFKGEKAFRAQQVFRWIHQRGANDFEQLSDLSKTLRERLAAEARLDALEILQEQKASDGTRKLRFGLSDSGQIEGVWMPSEKRRTLCVSTQVGCAMRCGFCATGSMGLRRSLTAGEIVGQVEAVDRHLRSDVLPRPVSHVVFMGMGEPLANLDATVAAVEILLHDLGARLSRRHVTVSTIGLVPAMREFARRCPVRLAVSLNATTDELRSRIMPINKRYPIGKLLETCRALRLKGAHRITFEYVLLGGLNDSDEDARRLVGLISDMRCKVNLIPYNPYGDLPFERPAPGRVLAFQDILVKADLMAFVRRSRGQDLQAACGQLVADAPP